MLWKRGLTLDLQWLLSMILHVGRAVWCVASCNEQGVEFADKGVALVLERNEVEATAGRHCEAKSRVAVPVFIRSKDG